MSQATSIIESKDLTKRYGNFTAVDKLTLTIREGEIFGLLGPNGAGKTTTILMLLGLTEPTSGMLKVCGYDPLHEAIKVKRTVGYLPERVGFYEDLTARQNLDYTAALNGLSHAEAERKIDEVLDTVGLKPKSDQLLSQFSLGMKQRLGIADVLIKNPKVAIFDEPTSGIDPEGVEQILSIILGMAKRKMSVILSSHQLHHVQRVCSRVGIMAKGHLVAEDSIENLGKATLGEGKFRIEVQAAPITEKVVQAIKHIKGIASVEVIDNVLKIGSESDVRNLIARAIIDNDSLATGMKIEEYNLEKIYLKYVKEQ
ncbi:MAG TPA: ABC transporter ATP-binding protein [Dehalococcoidia bacterium]|nr:ABC transporter ATP-binding protein [Dehalococcoidia bacterium]